MSKMIDVMIDILNSPRVKEAINKEVGKRVVPYDENNPATHQKMLIDVIGFSRSDSGDIAVDAIIA